jgi:hypothetical protein
MGRYKIKNLLILSTATLLATVCMANAGNLRSNTWRASCNTYYSNSGNDFIFKVKLGEIGGCRSDKVKQNSWDWSERSEVITKNEKMFGKWEWSATINIDRDCRPAYRNTLFQVHAGGYLVSPPSWVGINYDNEFRTNVESSTPHIVPNNPFKLTAKINATREDVKVDYFVNDQLVDSTHRYANGNGYKKMFFKFGIYRVNANCDITQTYTNVKLKKVK